MFKFLFCHFINKKTTETTVLCIAHIGNIINVLFIFNDQIVETFLNIFEDQILYFLEFFY
jgi:hypothetical protein